MHDRAEGNSELEVCRGIRNREAPCCCSALDPTSISECDGETRRSSLICSRDNG